MTGIELVAGGSGYTSPPTVTFGGRTNATATATLKVTGITLTNPGSNYQQLTNNGTAITNFRNSHVRHNVTLTNDFTLNADKILTLDSDKTLTIDSDKELINNGIIIDGYSQSSLDESGTITNDNGLILTRWTDSVWATVIPNNINKVRGTTTLYSDITLKNIFLEIWGGAELDVNGGKITLDKSTIFVKENAILKGDVKFAGSSNTPNSIFDENEDVNKGIIGTWLLDNNLVILSNKITQPTNKINTINESFVLPIDYVIKQNVVINDGNQLTIPKGKKLTNKSIIFDLNTNQIGIKHFENFNDDQEYETEYFGEVNNDNGFDFIKCSRNA